MSGQKKKQITGIGPASSAWEADVLPMNYICLMVLIQEILYHKKRIEINRYLQKMEKEC